MSSYTLGSRLAHTIVACSLLFVALGGVFTPSVRAGDATYRITGRVMECSSDLSQEAINSSIPPSCTVDVSGATVNSVTSSPQFGTEAISAQTSDNGGFVLLAGYADTATMLVGTALDDMNAGYLSCIYQTLDGTYAGEAVFPLDGSGQAEILYGAQGWYLATCNFFLYTIVPASVSFRGSVLLCDMDMSENVEPPLGEKCPLVGGSQLTQLTFPDGTNQQLSTDLQGQVSYSDLLAGQDYSLIVDRPSFYDGTTAICTEQANGTNLTEEFSVQGTADGAFSFSIQNSGAELACTILLFPKDTATVPDTGGDELNPKGTVTIDIGKYECPANFSGVTIDDYWNTCELTFNAIGFDIVGKQTGATDFQETGDLAEGVVIFEDVNPDDWQISERKPDGFGEPVVYCTVILQENDSRTDYAQMAVSEGNSIVEVVEGGTDLSCEWFNISDGGSNSTSGNGPSGADGSTERTFDATVLSCPLEYDVFADAANPASDCSEAQADVVLTATDHDGETVSGSTHSSGETSLALANMSGDRFTIEQEYPDLVGSSMIWSCERNGEDIDSPFLPVFELRGTNQIHVVIEEGDALTCLWLNLPEESETSGETGTTEPESGSMVSISVLECEGIPNPAACDPASEGFQTNLSDVENPALLVALETGDNGVATQFVPQGEYSISGDLTPCFVDSAAISHDGTLVIGSDPTVDLTLFVCT